MIKGLTKTLVNVSLGGAVMQNVANTSGMPDWAKTSTNTMIGAGIMGQTYKDLKLKKKLKLL